MLLEQITRRLAALAAEYKKTSKKEETMREAPPVGGFKTVGIKVDAETYTKLLAFMEREKIKNLRDAVIVILKRGLA